MGILSRILFRPKNRQIIQSISWHQKSRSVGISYKKYGATVTETETSKQDKTPVVVLLGWNDSKDKHLAKYSDIFTEKNYGTVRITTSSFNTFFRSGTTVKHVGHDILKVLDEMQCKERPVFLYAFSNGGCAVFLHIMKALSIPESIYFSKFNVVGSIFDSCPINTDIKSVKIVQESVTAPLANPLIRGLLWYGLGLFVPLVIYLNPTVKRFIDDMKNSQLMCDQLILYSKADRWAPYQDIDEYINARRALGVRVVAKCWENSAHVNHYREHTDEYLKLVNNFIDECLQNAKFLANFRIP